MVQELRAQAPWRSATPTYYSTKLDGNWNASFVTPASTSANPTVVPDANYHQPYVNELAFSFRHQFAGQWYGDIGYVYREYKDRTALVGTNAHLQRQCVRGLQERVAERDLQPDQQHLELAGLQGARDHRRQAVDKVQLLFSYTQVFPHLAGTWQPNDPASFIQPNAFPFDRGLLSNDNRTASNNNGLDITSAGQSSIEWMQQNGRANFVYHAPYDINFSASYTYQNGRYLGPIYTETPLRRIRSSDRATVTLSNGRVVANPLATTARLAYPTRSDGQFELSPLQYYNLEDRQGIPAPAQHEVRREPRHVQPGESRKFPGISFRLESPL